jgi:hypothetical protein
MKTSRTGRWAMGTMLALSGIAAIAFGPTARADAPASAMQGVYVPQAAMVKIDSAMLQERTVGADGTVSTQTYLDARPIQTAKASTSALAKPQAVTKA